MNTDQRPIASPAGSLDRLESAKLLGALACVSLLLFVVPSSLPPWAVFFLVLLTARAVWWRHFSSVATLIALCLFSQLVVGWTWGPVRELAPVDVAVSVALLAATVFFLRYVELDAGRFAWQSRVADPQNQAVRKHCETNAGLRPVSAALWRMPAAVMLAVLLLRAIPEESFMPNRYSFDPTVIRALVFGWLLLLAVLIPGSVLSLLRWRSLAPGQAQLYIRSQYFDDSIDQQMIERARAKALSKRGNSDEA